jgi:hypothetical protein
MNSRGCESKKKRIAHPEQWREDLRMGEWEWASDAIYGLAGVHPETPLAPSKLAKLLGIDVYAVPEMVDMGSLASYAGRSVIGVRDGQRGKPCDST